MTDSRTAIDVIVVDDRNIAICDEMRRTTVDSNENQDKERKTNKLEEGKIQIESLLIKNNPKNEEVKKVEEKCDYISQFDNLMDDRGYWNERDLDLFIAAKKRYEDRWTQLFILLILLPISN